MVVGGTMVVVQVVYKANKLASLIKKKEKYEGKIEVLLKKQAAKPRSGHPTMEVSQWHVANFLLCTVPSASLG